MSGLNLRRLLLVPLLAAVTTLARAERLPVRSYTTQDGLAHDAVERVVQDSRGYLWFCTQGGLSRFDGYGFVNYGKADGLPGDHVMDLLEADDGSYWVATTEGLASFTPSAKPGGRLFSGVQLGNTSETSQTLCLRQTSDGSIWAGTVGGLFKLVRNGSGWQARIIDLGVPADKLRLLQINTLLPDGRGGLWAGTRFGGLFRLDRQGGVSRTLPDLNVRSLRMQGDDLLWVSSRSGLWRLVLDRATGQPGARTQITRLQGLPDDFVRDTLGNPDGTTLIATEHGLGQLAADAADARMDRFGLPEGLSHEDITDLAEDRHGNVWLATKGGGAMRLQRGGFTTYREADGLRGNRHAAILESRAGDLLMVSTNERRQMLLQQFDGARFHSYRLPLRTNEPGWGWSQLVVHSRTREWWVATGEGLYRFPATDDVARLARMAPMAIYTSRDGLGADAVFRLFEDSRGDLWMTAGSLVRRDARTGRFHLFTAADGYTWGWASAFAEDRSGNVWIGVYGGNLLRYRDGRFTSFGPEAGMADGAVVALYVDGTGRLWVGTDGGGLARADEPAAERPSFTLYSSTDGLYSRRIQSITEDRWGRIYLGTDGGVDRLDPATGSLRRFTLEDGLPTSWVAVSYRDRRGDLWMMTSPAISRLRPAPDPPPTPPPVLISALRITGTPHPISPLGQASVSGFSVDPGGGPVEVEFTGLDFAPGEVMRYQYRLGGDPAEWSDPSERRAVTLAGLSPGRYRLEVRAINSSGLVSPVPASLSFEVPVPVWRRWWFVSAAAIALAALLWMAHRHRLRRLLELERVRSRIATDLHDDVGSTLTQVAILSEVALRQINEKREGSGDAIRRIAEVSRAAVDSISDIVWSIDPQTDSLADLMHRMRRFAGEVCAGRGIELQMTLPDDSAIVVAPEVRRHVLLIVKEAVNNAVRHSGCARVSISLEVDGRALVLRVEDDGSGLASGRAQGHGLASMRRRAQAIEGTLDIVTAPGRGTCLTLEAPLSTRPARTGLSERTGGSRSARM